MSPSDKPDVSALEELLEGRSPEFKERVLTFVAKMGMGVNDPSFLFAVAMGQLEVLLEDSPASMVRLFNVWTSELRKTLDLAETVLVEEQKSAIAKAARELIAKAEKVESQRLWKSVVPAAGIVAITLGLGFFAGMTVPVYWQGGYSADKPVQLTRVEADALEWATSGEGKLARNLVKWNAGYLEGCASQAGALAEKGVSLTWGGQPAKSGFCVLWVRPPG